MIKIYCEDVAMTKEIKSLQNIADIELISFPFENKNRKVIRSNYPSELTMESTFITLDDTKIDISNTDRSEIFELIEKVIGANNYNDIRHIDTAYKEKCQIFVSPDKGDIISKSNDLEKYTGIKFFYCRDFESIRMEIDKIMQKE